MKELCCLIQKIPEKNEKKKTKKDICEFISWCYQAKIENKKEVPQEKKNSWIETVQ